jgi:hypothetical protein
LGLVLANAVIVAFAAPASAATAAAVASFVYDLVLLGPATLAACVAARKESHLHRRQRVAIVLMPLVVEAALVGLFGNAPAGWTSLGRAAMRVAALVGAASVAVLVKPKLGDTHRER